MNFHKISTGEKKQAYPPGNIQNNVEHPPFVDLFTPGYPQQTIVNTNGNGSNPTTPHWVLGSTVKWIDFAA